MTTTFQGHSFNSEAETTRARELWRYQLAGDIRGLVYHPEIRLSEPSEFPRTLSFGYIESGLPMWELFLSHPRMVYQDIVDLWPEHGVSLLRITKAISGKGVMVKEVRAERSET